MNESALLRCEVSRGMFEDEVAICVTTMEGDVLSFFMPADFVKTFAERPEEKAIPVQVLERNGEWGFVALPRRSFEGPNAATVPARALRFA